MLSVHKDIWDVEMSVDNVHMQMERVEDRLNVLSKMSCCLETVVSQSWGTFLEVQNHQVLLQDMDISLLGKFEKNSTIIDRQLVHLRKNWRRLWVWQGRRL